TRLPHRTTRPGRGGGHAAGRGGHHRRRHHRLRPRLPGPADRGTHPRPSRWSLHRARLWSDVAVCVGAPRVRSSPAYQQPTVGGAAVPDTVTSGGPDVLDAAVRYVTVKGHSRVHAQVTVDLERNRTVCGLPVDAQAPKPTLEQRCGECWLDWRV